MRKDIRLNAVALKNAANRNIRSTLLPHFAYLRVRTVAPIVYYLANKIRNDACVSSIVGVITASVPRVRHQVQFGKGIVRRRIHISAVFGTDKSVFRTVYETYWNVAAPDVFDRTDGRKIISELALGHNIADIDDG